jgi:tRNA A37 methylthiotransferase MiaB
MRHQVPAQIARERSRILRELSDEKKSSFMQSFVGKTVEAITLNVFDGQRTEALTDNYLKLRLKGRHEANRWVAARVEQVQGSALLATL